MKGRPGAVALALSSNSAQMGVDPENELVKALLAHDEQAAIDIVGDAPSAGTYGLSKHAVARACVVGRMNGDSRCVECYCARYDRDTYASRCPG